jgi:hypothetical protein
MNVRVVLILRTALLGCLLTALSATLSIHAQQGPPQQQQPNRLGPGGGQQPSGQPQNIRPPQRPPAHTGQSVSRPVRRPPQWGRPPASRPSFAFRPGDRNLLRNHYAARLRLINRARRPVFRVGTFFPFSSLALLSPVPRAMWGSLPPIPPGYAVGFFDGWVIVYDPVTGWIAGVVDLM